VAFISFDDFARIAGNRQAVSFVLVKIAPGASASTVATRIEQRVQGVTALPREAFAAQERKLVKDMASDMITIMNWAGFLVGLAVLALIVYTATLARRKEYGMLKALGVRNQQLYGAVASQAVSCTVLGLLLAVVLTVALSAIVPSVQPTLTLEISALSLLKVGAISLIITVLAALLPIKQIAGLDPAMVFKGA
jgi:putative ABC transport system permease protein